MWFRVSFYSFEMLPAETNLQDKYKVKATQSITDQLTGLYNRTYFDQYLPEMLEVVKKASVVMTRRYL